MFVFYAGIVAQNAQQQMIVRSLPSGEVISRVYTIISTANYFFSTRIRPQSLFTRLQLI